MRRRNHVVPLRLTAKELHRLNEQAGRSGLSREEFLRSLVKGTNIKAKPCTHHADLLHKLAGLCNNANQLARVANTYGQADQASVDEMVRIARMVWEHVKEGW